MREFQEILKDCLRDEPPFCSAVCPFGLDVRDFITKLQRGSFNSAFRLYQNTVGFPEIVAKICPHPCQEACIRTQVDTFIELKKLEQAAVTYATNTRPNRYYLPAKGKRIAIIGAGLGGLGAALRLTARKYEVTLYEKTNRIGGELWNLLPPEEFISDLEAQFVHEQYEIHFNTEITDLNDISADAILIATGKTGNQFGLGDVPGATTRAGVFLCAVGHPIEALASGLEMAGVIEGYLKTSIMRSPESKHPTKLKMDPRYIRPLPTASRFGIPFSKEDAVAEAQRCIKCQCDACLRNCDLMKFYGKAPKRIEEEVEITIHPGTLDGDGTVATRLIATCNHCDVCKLVCPQGIDTGAFLLQSHRAMEEKGAMPWVFHEFWLRDLEFSNSDQASVRKAPPGVETSSWMYIPGCRLGGSDPQYVLESYEYLLQEAPDTALLQGCCGAPALWAGNIPLFQQTLEQIRKDWLSFGKPKAIFACSTCQRIYRDHLPEIEGISLYEWMDSHDFNPPQNASVPVCVFDPCQSAGQPQMQHAVRSLVQKSGLAIAQELDMPRCCGWGGQVAIANPKYYDGVVKSRSADSAFPYVTYCANCRDVFADSGKPAYHLLDLLFGLNQAADQRPEERKAPTASMSRLHRRQLKKALYQRFFEEEWEMPQAQLRLFISDELKEKLNRAMILIEDLEAVIIHCETTDAKILHDDGSFSGHLVIGQMTFWVQYRPHEEGYLLENAYCHRMQIGE